MGRTTEIDWCDSTWNPVTGCLRGCEYCYARRIAERFRPEHVCGVVTVDSAEKPKLRVLDEPMNRCEEESDGLLRVYEKAAYPFGFEPTFHRYKLDEPQRWKKPRTIFVCSMADLFGDWVPDEWIAQVFEACEKAPWHRYIFLTKYPQRLMLMAAAMDVKEGMKYRPQDMAKIEGHTPLPKHDNWWFGSTIDNKNARRFQSWGYHSFSSIEPLTEFMDVGIGSFGSDKWIIVGAETGNRKNKVVPEREWVENIVEAARITRAKVFMKESLRSLMGPDFKQEFPWEVNT